MIIIFLALALFDIVIFRSDSDLAVLFFIVFWIYLVFAKHWQTSQFLKWGVILLVPTAFFLIFQANLIAEKLAFWIYVLFTSAVLRETFLKIKK